ncbi:MAG: dienelactone hydrolase family protein [Propionibacteriaceae bacterium]
MSSTTVDLATPDGVADATLARPEQVSAHPGVLFLMDAFGLRDTITAMAERIAAAGYVVLAPNTLYRAGRAPVAPFPDMTDPDARGAFFAALAPARDQLSPEAIRRDGAAYLDYLESLPGVAPGPLAITGYCFGGTLGWRIAADHPEQVAALATFHAGNVVTDGPDSPHLGAGDIDAELYLAHADHDQSMSAEMITTAEHALDAAGVTYRSEVYAGAAHGFTMADTPTYAEEAAERHVSELFALLGRTFGR